MIRQMQLQINTISFIRPSADVGTGSTRVAVKDNEDGIPAQIVDKIFQSFFANKLTRQGTGLGFSLVYDFVKSHGGEIQINTMQGVLRI